MSKQKPIVDIHDEQKQRIKELEALVKDLEAKAVAGEEGALARVCKAAGYDPKEIKAKESVIKDTRMIRCFVPNKVNVNGTVYLGDVTVPIDTFYVIQQAIGDRRMRLLRELTGNNYILTEIMGVGFAPRVVGQVGMDGAPLGPTGGAA